MKSLSPYLFPAIPLLLACGVEDIAEEEFDDVTVTIVSPSYMETFVEETEITFEVEALHEDGTPATITDVTWISSFDRDWYLSGVSASSNLLSPGLHTIKAIVTFPDASTQSPSVDIVILSRLTGEFEGPFYSHIIYSGTYGNFELDCNGGIWLEVEDYGEYLEGEGQCTIEYMGFEYDLPLTLDGEISEVLVEGNLTVELGGEEYTTPYEGTFIDEDNLEADFEGTYSDGENSIDITGEFSATRLTI